MAAEFLLSGEPLHKNIDSIETIPKQKITHI